MNDTTGIDATPAAPAFRIAPDFKPPTVPAFFLRLMLAGYICILTWSAWISFRVIAYVQAVIGGTYQSEADFFANNEPIEEIAAYMPNAVNGQYIFCALVYLWFVYVAAANCEESRAARFKRSAEGAVGVSFIPVANFVLIYRVMRDIWVSSLDPEHCIERPSNLLPFWWITFLVGAVGGRVTDIAASRAMDDDNVDVALSWSWLSIGATAVSIISALLLFGLVTRITRAQSQWKWRSRPTQPASTPDPAPAIAPLVAPPLTAVDPCPQPHALWSAQAKPLGGLHAWLRGALYVYVAADLLAAILNGALLWLYAAAEGGAQFSDMQLSLFDFLSGYARMIGSWTFLASYALAAFLFCRFVYRAIRNLDHANATGDRMPASWAVAYNFIPLMNLWKPMMAMRQIWRGSLDPDRKSIAPPATIGVWWTFWLMSSLITYAALVFSLESGAASGQLANFEGYKTSLWLEIMSSVVATVSVFCLLAIVRRITTAQDVHTKAA